MQSSILDGGLDSPEEATFSQVEVIPVYFSDEDAYDSADELPSRTDHINLGLVSWTLIIFSTKHAEPVLTNVTMIWIR